MTACQTVFQRIEKKYLLNARQYDQLRQALATRMVPDAYGRHTISSLYYDTPDDALIRTSMQHPVYKEKLRLRSYGAVQENSTVFLEIKKKFRGVVYKRRAPMTLQQARAYMEFGSEPDGDEQILREIDWFMNRYRPVPRMLVSYERVALFDEIQPEVRVTFDRNIRFRTGRLDPAYGDSGTAILGIGAVLMEIKIPGVMPLWLAQALSALSIFSVPFSKYASCYQMVHALDGKQQTGDVFYA